MAQLHWWHRISDNVARNAPIRQTYHTNTHRQEFAHPRYAHVLPFVVQCAYVERRIQTRSCMELTTELPHTPYSPYAAEVVHCSTQHEHGTHRNGYGCHKHHGYLGARDAQYKLDMLHTTWRYHVHPASCPRCMIGVCETPPAGPYGAYIPTCMQGLLHLRPPHTKYNRPRGS